MKEKSTVRGRPKQLSRKPAEAKAEIQSGDLWGQQASQLLKQTLDGKDWGYRQLSQKLATMGIDVSAPTINRRINRGNFTAGFLLMCLKAMGAGFEVCPEDGAAPARSEGAGKTAKPQKPVDALETLFGGWSVKKSTD